MGEFRVYHREALDVLDLESWLSQYVNLKDGGGDERRIHECPKCFDDEYKLYVNVEKKVWICYKCDWGRKVADSYVDIVELMSAVSGRHETEIRIELASMVVPAPAGDITDKLNSLFDATASRVEIIAPKEVDVPGNDSFLGLSIRPAYQYALKRGLNPWQVKELALRGSYTIPTPRFAVPGPWLVFPVRIIGKPVAWQGRRVDYDGDVKYLSSADIHDWLWPLDDSFFRVYQVGGQIVLVEGVFDALGFLRYKVPALCTFGKTITDRQLILLKELRPSEVVVCWDADVFQDRRTARATLKSIERIAFAFPRASVVDTSRADGRKIDAGNALNSPGEVVPWLTEKLKMRMDVQSPEFWRWKLERMAA